jgi:hypothetical protein
VHRSKTTVENPRARTLKPSEVQILTARLKCEPLDLGPIISQSATLKYSFQ